MTVQHSRDAAVAADAAPAHEKLPTQGSGPSARRRSSWHRSVRQLSLAALFDRRSAPLVWQLPITAAFAVGVALVFVIPSSAITSVLGFAIGGALVLAATLWATAASHVRVLAPFFAVAPILDFVAIAVLRAATGGTVSVFSGLTILPLVWLATRRGKRFIVYAFLGTVLVVLGPILAEGRYLESPSELLRSLFVAAVYALAAWVIHLVSAQARKRYEQIKRRDAARAQDLTRGAEAQQALLPGNMATLGGFSAAGVCLPAQAVGGDFYDWYTTPDGAAFTLGDVMGKGVGAGIIAATTRAVLRSARGKNDPVTALTRADDCLAYELSDMHPFATVFHARASAVDGSVRYSDAGHGLSLLIRADRSWRRLAAFDLPLGLGLGGEWGTRTVRMNTGDAVVSFSDGLLDLYGGDDDAIEQIATICSEAADSAAGIVDAVIARAPGYNQSDDVTVIAFRRD